MTNSDNTPKLPKTLVDMVREYHETAGLATDVDFPKSSAELMAMRYKLVQEELQEMEEEFRKPFGDSIDELLKEMADVVYVIVGWCVTFGYDFDEVFRRVHENNMGRMCQDDGSIKYREDGKVMKNPNAPKIYLGDLT